jgi:hypothetical protein
VCGSRGASIGVLCERCSEELADGVVLAPQQLEANGAGATPAALVDLWGYPHHLGAKTTLGRAADSDLTILEPSVSRVHADLEQGEPWVVRDLGSTAGTFVNGEPVRGSRPLRDGDCVRFGDVAFYFVASAPRLPPRAKLDVPTHHHPTKQTTRIELVNRPEVPFELHAPSGGGGGFAVIDGKHVQLTAPQFELVERLVRAMVYDVGPDEQRGFVPATALFGLSLDSADPSEDHVRQLVRRVRRLLAKAELGDLIEVRRGVGYRLRVMPKLEPVSPSPRRR